MIKILAIEKKDIDFNNNYGEKSLKNSIKTISSVSLNDQTLTQTRLKMRQNLFEFSEKWFNFLGKTTKKFYDISNQESH